jgi:hypothetical protein
VLRKNEGRHLEHLRFVAQLVDQRLGIGDLDAGLPLGRLDDLRPRITRLPAIVVRPFVALLERSDPLELSSEVALAFWVPFGSLARTDAWQNDTVVARGIQINARVFHHEDHIVWGMTERILTQLIELVGRREQGGGRR